MEAVPTSPTAKSAVTRVYTAVPYPRLYGPVPCFSDLDSVGSKFLDPDICRLQQNFLTCQLREIFLSTNIFSSPWEIDLHISMRHYCDSRDRLSHGLFPCLSNKRQQVILACARYRTFLDKLSTEGLRLEDNSGIQRCYQFRL